LTDDLGLTAAACDARRRRAIADAGLDVEETLAAAEAALAAKTADWARRLPAGWSVDGHDSPKPEPMKIRPSARERSDRRARSAAPAAATTESDDAGDDGPSKSRRPRIAEAAPLHPHVRLTLRRLERVTLKPRKQLARDVVHPDPARRLRARREGKRWWTVLWGDYLEFEAREAALAEPPAPSPTAEAWVRARAAREAAAR
jgi:hypothetical protein